MKDVRALQTIPGELVKPFKSSFPARLAQSRAELLEKLLVELGTENSGLTLENVITVNGIKHVSVMFTSSVNLNYCENPVKLRVTVAAVNFLEEVNLVFFTNQMLASEQSQYEIFIRVSFRLNFPNSNHQS